MPAYMPRNRYQSLSFSLFVVALAACVYETGLLLVCACRTSAASVEPLTRGSRRRFPSLASCSKLKLLDVAHCSLFHQHLCFGFIGANNKA